MYPELTLGAFQFKSYVTMNYLGFLAAAVYGYRQLVRREHIRAYQVLFFLVLLFFVQTLGGAFIPFLYRWYGRGAFPSDLPYLHAGRYYHSILLSALIFLTVYCRLKRWPVKAVMDYFAIGAALMSPIVRIGCFLAGCCAGKPTNLPWGVKFPFGHEHLHPTQLYHFTVEALVILPLLLLIEKRKRFGGQTFLSYFCLYAVFRFFVEFVRTNPIIAWGLTPAQLFSMGAFVVCASLLVMISNRIANRI